MQSIGGDLAVQNMSAQILPMICQTHVVQKNPNEMSEWENIYFARLNPYSETYSSQQAAE